MTPYIGITDFENEKQVRDMHRVVMNHGPDKNGRKLMVGVMMSYKTLHGLPTKWSSIFPPKETLPGIFLPLWGTLNTLHYADYDGIDVLESLNLATTFCGQFLHAVQLDMIWPDSAAVKKYKESHPTIKIILQANSSALETAKNDPDKFLIRLKEYGDALNYILLDKSMGRGLGMDASDLMPFADALAEHRPDLGIAAAGGLGPETLNLVEPLAERFPLLSIDAQGKLRPSGDSTKPVDWKMAEQYIINAFDMFKRYSK